MKTKKGNYVWLDHLQIYFLVTGYTAYFGNVPQLLTVVIYVLLCELALAVLGLCVITFSREINTEVLTYCATDKMTIALSTATSILLGIGYSVWIGMAFFMVSFFTMLISYLRLSSFKKAK